jgi:hypothetical protein
MNLGSQPQAERRFLFDAHASTLRGKLTRPSAVTFRSSGTLTVPLSGGEETTRETGLGFEGVLKIGQAESVVTGAYDANADCWKTTLAVTVRDLDILGGRLKADLLEARLTESFHAKDGERTFSIAGSRIDGLVIEGQPVDLNYYDRPFLQTNWRKVVEDSGSDEKLQQRLENKDAGFRGRKSPASLLCSLSMPGPLANGKASVHPGAQIVIPNFGRIWLAELFMTPDTWRLTMLRAKLGSPAEGEFEIAEASANGHRYPP